MQAEKSSTNKTNFEGSSMPIERGLAGATAKYSEAQGSNKGIQRSSGLPGPPLPGTSLPI